VSIRIWAYRTDGDILLRPSVEELPSLMEDPKVHLWVDIADSGVPEERFLSEVMRLHPLVVEDILQESQPKLEIHDRYLYLIVHSIQADRADPDDLGTVELDVLLGERFVLTHHSEEIRSVEAVAGELARSSAILGEGPAQLAHAVIDRLIDKYPPLMERFDAVIGALDLEILKKPRADVLQRIFELKRSLQTVRRIGMHQKDILRQLSSDALPHLPEALRPFFRDVYDHFLRATDLADGYRDHVSGALDAYLGVQSHKLNEIMKVLAIISTIMLPLTFITGLYGMNFERIPELGWGLGYAWAWGWMLLTAGGFLVYFRRRHWI
jgi:magnesium transporter